MFKKFKDKIAEEMKQSPARLQAGMQQLAQAVVSPALSNSSIQELSTSNDNFSLTEEGDETPKNSPVKHGFQNVNLVTPPSNSMGISRRSSVSSVTSDSSSLFPIYESPSNLYHLQSDIDQSASEVDENIGPQLDRVTKDQLYSAYRKVSAKYHKYRGRYTDLVTHYRELERAKTKLESVLVETQDKVLRRIADLKEQCQLEQQAKAHLEEVLRTDIEEKDHIINTLNTKIKLLQAEGPSGENPIPEQSESKENAKVDLIDLSNDSSNSTNENVILTAENAQLKEKLKKLESVVLKYKDLLKRSKAKLTEVMDEKEGLERDHEIFKTSITEETKLLGNELASAREEITNLTDQVNALKKREEECVISLAENKLSIHRELEDKEEQIKQFRIDLKQMTESKESFREAVEKYRIELEKFRSDCETAVDANSKTQKNMHDDKSDTRSEDSSKDSDSLSEKEVADLQAQLRGLQIELSTLRNENKELRNESEATKIVADDKRREAESTIQNLQATIHSLDREVGNMRDALTDRDRVCETYKSKMQEYIGMQEKSKEQFLTQEAELRDLRRKLEEIEREKSKELDDSLMELSKIRKELGSYKKRSDALNSLVAVKETVRQMKNDWHNLKDFTRENILSESNFLEIVKTSIEQELRNKLQTYEKRLSKQANLETELNKTRELLEEAMRKAEQFDNINVTNSKLVAEIENLQCKIRDLESVQAEAASIREENKNMAEKLKQLEELKIKHEQASKSIELLTSASAEAADFEREIQSLKSENIHCVNIIAQKEEEIKDLVKRLTNDESNVAQIVELKQQIAILKNVELKHEELIKETESLRQKLVELDSATEELSELRSKYEESTKTIDSLKSSNEGYESLGQENEKLKTELVAVSNQSAANEEEIKLVKNEIEKLQEKNKTLQDTIGVKNMQLKKLKVIKDQRDDNVQEFKQKVSKLQEENAQIELLKQTNLSIEQQLSDITAENKDLKTKQNELMKSNEELRMVEEILKVDLKEYKEILDESQARERELQNVKKSLALENFQLSQKIGVLEKTHENEIQLMQEEKKDLIEKLKTLQGTESNSEQLNQEIQNLNKEIAAAQSASTELSELKIKYDEAEKTINELQSANKEYVQFGEALKNIKEEMVKKDEDIRHLNEKLSIEEEQMRKLRQDWDSNSKSMNEQVAEMTEKNKSLEDAITTKSEQLQKLESLKESQGKTIEELTEEIDSIKLQNTELSVQLDGYKNEIDALKMANSQIETLREENSSITSQLEQLTTERDQISAENTELKNVQQTHLSKIQQCEREAIDFRKKLDMKIQENVALVNQITELSSTVQSLRVFEEQNKVLVDKISCFKGTDEENAKLKADLISANENIARLEEMKIEQNKLDHLKNINQKLQSQVDELTHAVSSTEQFYRRTCSENDKEIAKLRVEVDELKATIEEKQAELKLLDTKNTELLREVEKTNGLSAKAMEESVRKSEELENTIKLLKQKNAQLETEVGELLRSENKPGQEGNSDEDTSKLINKLQRENKKLEAQLDEALITFQSKEAQMQAANNESKMNTEKLKNELKTHDEEQNMRLKQLVKEFQAQLRDKEEELQAALEKRFDRQKNYESDLIQQYKEQLKDFQVELTAKSEQIESLIIENKDLSTDKGKEISRLSETINQIKKDHANEIKEIEKKWKTIMQQRTEKLENKHEEEINELTREWRNERRPNESDPNFEELESTSRVAMAAVQSNTGSFHTLQQTLTSQKRELTELRKLVKLRQETLEDSTEIEYLRNILFEYMMGRETMVLARVIAAVVKFDQQQTAKILKKEEDKLTLLGSLGLT